jgi:hypothetical protein
MLFNRLCRDPAYVLSPKSQKPSFLSLFTGNIKWRCGDSSLNTRDARGQSIQSNANSCAQTTYNIKWRCGDSSLNTRYARGQSGSTRTVAHKQHTSMKERGLNASSATRYGRLKKEKQDLRYNNGTI